MQEVLNEQMEVEGKKKKDEVNSVKQHIFNHLPSASNIAIWFTKTIIDMDTFRKADYRL